MGRDQLGFLCNIKNLHGQNKPTLNSSVYICPEFLYVLQILLRKLKLLYVAMVVNDFANQAIFDGLFGTHPVITVCIFLDFIK